MACQYALLRLAIPGAISTAVMTGNLTNTVLSLMDLVVEAPCLARSMPAACEILASSPRLSAPAVRVVSACAVSVLRD
jgi:hypothetical protein